MNNWDLYIVSPILIFFTSLALFVFYKRNKLEKKWFFYFFHTILVWTAATILIEKNSMQINQVILNSNLGIVLLITVLGSWLLFASFFKIIIAKFSNKFLSRMFFIKFSNIFLIFGLVLVFIFPSNQWWYYALLVINAIVIGLAIASQSLYFLFLNEQKYNKFFPLKVSFGVGFLIAFSTYLGYWILNINKVMLPNSSNLSIFLAILMAFFGLVIAYFQKENVSKVGEFSTFLKYEFTSYQSKTLLKLVLLTLILGIIYGIIQSPFLKLYMAASAKLESQSLEWIVSIERKFSSIFIFAQFGIGFLTYKLLLPKTGIKNLMIGVLALCLVTLLISSFVINIWLILIFNLVFGSVYFMMLYAWFGFALMWNCRAKSVPVSGWVAGTLLFGQFSINFVIILFINLNHTLFMYVNIEQIIAETNYINLEKFVWSLKKIIKVTSALAFAVNCFYLLLCILWIDEIIAEYDNISNLMQKITVIEKKLIEKKIITRIKME